MRRVILESPYSGEVERNVRYARACVADSLKRHEAPFASHLLYTQEGILNDLNPEERERGIAAGFVWRHVCDLTVVYVDLGYSKGMDAGIEHARNIGQEIVYRSLGPKWIDSTWQE